MVYWREVRMVKTQVKKIVGYVRTYSESQTDNTSTELQIQKIKDYCRLYDLKVNKIFVDEAQSGKTHYRQSYQEMMEYISDPDNEINAIVVYKSDTTHRELKNLLIMNDKLKEQGIAYISITENFDTSTPQGMLFLQMIVEFPEFKRKIINEQSKMGRVEKAKSNKFVGGEIPFGYRLINSDKLEIDPTESDIVKQIFELRVGGKSLDKIAKELNDKGIKNKQGKEWTRQAIDYILKNQIYTGKNNYDGKKEKSNMSFKIEKIISKQLYNKANIREIKGMLSTLPVDTIKETLRLQEQALVVLSSVKKTNPTIASTVQFKESIKKTKRNIKNLKPHLAFLEDLEQLKNENKQEKEELEQD